MRLTEIDKDKIMISKVEVTLQELENLIENLGGLFELTDSGALAITFPRTGRTFIYSNLS